MRMTLSMACGVDSRMLMNALYRALTRRGRIGGIQDVDRNCAADPGLFAVAL
jgi:hypothetical protein